MDSEAFRHFSGPVSVKPPNDASNGRTATVGPYIAQKCAKEGLVHPRIVETIRTKSTRLVEGRRNHSRAIFGILSLEIT